MGYLATEDTSEYLSRALVDTLRGTLADNENRLRTLLFKLCVEVNMMGHNKGHLCYQMTYLLRQRRHGRRCARWGTQGQSVFPYRSAWGS